MRFIYVMCSEHKDKLVKLGYKLLKEDKRNGVFVFENREEFEFEKLDIPHVLSDTLTF